MWRRVVDGQKCTATVPRHDPIATGTLRSIRRALRLTADDGFPDERFFDPKGWAKSNDDPGE